MEEGLTIIRGALDDGPFSFSGRHYQLKDASVYPKPVQRPLPFWVGARSTPAAQRAARHDASLLLVDVGGNAKETYAAYSDGLRARGRDPKDFGLQGMIVDSFFISDDPDATMEEIRPYVEWQSTAMKGWYEESALSGHDPALLEVLQREGRRRSWGLRGYVVDDAGGDRAARGGQARRSAVHPLRLRRGQHDAFGFPCEEDVPLHGALRARRHRPFPLAPVLESRRKTPLRRRTMASTMKKSTITLEAAKAMIEASEAKASEIGVPMCTAIVDPDGNLKAFSRMDGAALLSIKIAQDKGYTAVGFGLSTKDWWQFIKDDGPLLHGITHAERLIIYEGGIPIQSDGEIVGGIGVSGGYYTQDQECAEAGIEAFGNL